MNSMTRILFAVLSALAVPAALRGQSQTDSPTVPTLPDVRAELLRLVIEDQWDRGNDMFGGRQVRPADALNWQAIADHDEQRQRAVRTLLANGQVETGREYHFAALIFQHSTSAEGLKLAHVLAMTAVAKGNGKARWLAAATFDRYLHSLKEPQVFGTQFVRGPGDSSWSMDPYDRDAISDSIRALWCVVPISDQDRMLKEFQAGKQAAASTSIPDCR